MKVIIELKKDKIINKELEYCDKSSFLKFL